MRTDYWYAIWTGLAAILVLDTLLVRGARLKRRTTRLSDNDDVLMPCVLLAFVAIVLGIVLGIVFLIDHYG